MTFIKAATASDELFISTDLGLVWELTPRVVMNTRSFSSDSIRICMIPGST